VVGNILLFFYKKKIKNNNKILPATSAYYGAVVRNECRDHFSFINGECYKNTLYTHLIHPPFHMGWEPYHMGHTLCERVDM
jgi:hypothetical protein